MASDLITLKLNGEIPLGLFADAIKSLRELIDALSVEVANTSEIEWNINDLEAGSAFATVRGKYYDMQSVEKVVEAYRTVGNALENKRAIPYSEAISKPARAITSLINGHITSVSFGVDSESYLVESPIHFDEEEEKKSYSLGTIRGVAGTITNRPTLKLTVFDSLFDRAVLCYLTTEHREKVRNAWDKQVEVTGMIFRDPDTGRPIEIRDVIKVEVIESGNLVSVRQARGVLYNPDDKEPAEVTIRRLRDVG